MNRLTERTLPNGIKMVYTDKQHTNSIESITLGDYCLQQWLYDPNAPNSSLTHQILRNLSTIPTPIWRIYSLSNKPMNRRKIPILQYIEYVPPEIFGR